MISFIKDIYKNLENLRKKFEGMLVEVKKKQLLEINGSNFPTLTNQNFKSNRNILFLQKNESWVLMMSIMTGIEKSIEKKTIPNNLDTNFNDFLDKEVYHINIK